VVSRATLLTYIADHPEFALELMSRLIRRARLATESARSVALIDVYGRLTRLLNQLASQPNALGERPLRERLTHQELAQHLACSREMVSRLLKDLETGGYVAVRERWIWLLKPLPRAGSRPASCAGQRDPRRVKRSNPGHSRAGFAGATVSP
jgi:CRP/FNR family cyclic AMP-dependent transcriptional regulator